MKREEKISSNERSWTDGCHFRKRGNKMLVARKNIMKIILSEREHDSMICVVHFFPSPAILPPQIENERYETYSNKNFPLIERSAVMAGQIRRKLVMFLCVPQVSSATGILIDMRLPASPQTSTRVIRSTAKRCAVD